MSGAFAALVARELRLALRAGGGTAVGAVFFLAVVTLIPFGVGPDRALLARIAPAVLWLGALLATLLGLDRLVQADQEDGSLDLLHLSGLPLELVVLGKIVGQWLSNGLPLVVLSPVLGLALGLPAAGLWAVPATLLIGTPALTALGAVGASLTVGLRRGGLIVPVLILPLVVPVLIFGVSAAEAAIVGPMPVGPPLLILAALTLFALVLAPIAGAAALRLAQGES